MRHSKRKRNVREPKKIILIVCEGETEKNTSIHLEQDIEIIT